jgi:hypothetical protein
MPPHLTGLRSPDGGEIRGHQAGNTLRVSASDLGADFSDVLEAARPKPWCEQQQRRWMPHLIEIRAQLF